LDRIDSLVDIFLTQVEDFGWIEGRVDFYLVFGVWIWSFRIDWGFWLEV
jgi:hypothetical protein